MTGPETCARCGRAVPLRYRTREGRICSNCCAIANSAACCVCGEHRRVAKRIQGGQPCCERCWKRDVRQTADVASAQTIIDAVTAVERSLSADGVRAVLTETVGTRRSLLRVVAHLVANPDVFSVGPTSLVPALDRFTRGLVAAGAQSIVTIDPICDDCGRQRPRHARSAGGGGICPACWARNNKTACAVCGQIRRVVCRDRDGQGMCSGCLAQRRRRALLDEMADQITAILRDTDPSVTRDQIGVGVDRVAQMVPDRALLVELLAGGLSTADPARRHPIVARLLTELRTNGADLPGVICGDCSQSAEPFVAHGGVVRCHSCERCRERDDSRGTDAAAYQLIIEAVTAAEGSLSEELVRRALEEAVSSRRSLLGLASHVAAHPDVFSAGPTTVMAVLDRFTQTLVAAGAQSVRSIHPVCDSCGRQRRRHARSAGGGLCATCWARDHNRACTACGQVRSIDRRDDHGGALCRHCVRRDRRRHHLDDMVSQITAVLGGTVPSPPRHVVVTAIERVAETVPARVLLIEHLTTGPSLSTAGRRPPIVARFLTELRAGGAAIPAATCEDCERPAEPLVIHRGVVRCQTCVTHCATCDHRRARPPKGKCRWCNIAAPRPRCTHCGSAPRGGLGDDGRCRKCQQQTAHRCIDCGQTNKLTRHRDKWICHSCILAIELDDCLGPPGLIPTPLVPLRAAIVGANNPAGVRKWLANTSGGQLLARLAAGQAPLTHDTLDDAGEDRSIAHLRALLVATGALADEDRSIERLERFFDHYLETHVANSGDCKVVRAWLRWRTLPRMRKRAASGASMAHSANNARRALHQVIEFLDRLHHQGRNLQTATQADLDHWFAHPGPNPWLVRPFLVWAQRRAHLPRDLRLPDTPPQVQRPSLDDSRRWTIARRLVNDDALPADDRVAAALVVLYAQSVTSVARLATTDIHSGPDGTVTVDLDGNRLPVHEPFATLMGHLPLRRTHGVTEQIGTTWLFPGGHAGKHVTPVILGNRLKAMGIEPRNMRNTARAQLATEIPPALLGKLIGVSPGTATRWATLTSSNWTAYAADRAQ